MFLSPDAFLCACSSSTSVPACRLSACGGKTQTPSDLSGLEERLVAGIFSGSEPSRLRKWCSLLPLHRHLPLSPEHRHAVPPLWKRCLPALNQHWALFAHVTMLHSFSTTSFHLQRFCLWKPYEYATTRGTRSFKTHTKSVFGSVLFVQTTRGWEFSCVFKGWFFCTNLQMSASNLQQPLIVWFPSYLE